MNKRHIVMLGVVIVALIAMLGSKPFWASLNGETGFERTVDRPHAGLPVLLWMLSKWT